ncbi:Uma2 family endonuclease [Spirosoma endbachense]|uniref:Uma2 family endonuclease n=1 Tax=Spirosoma endbachense TaxID=2666025 RepID=A0A6P1VSV0_9BACT|nr:Uma2 family endonuclease [Spirosoma endbachense]QHV94787.1 Uma2 family endonuclease [Spirosoma endbachense]
MEVIQKVQLTDEQVEKLAVGGVVSVPASWDEFMDFLHETFYRVEYHNGQIIIMGLAAFIHELLIGRIITLLTNLYSGTDYYVAGSNVGVLTTEGKGYYNPDITVVKGTPKFRQGSNAIITNPYLLVEVLSESTAAYDLYHKLPKYEQMDSLQEVVIVDRFDQSISTFRRTDTLNVWTQTIYDKPSEQVRIDQFTILQADVFANLPTVKE